METFSNLNIFRKVAALILALFLTPISSALSTPVYFDDFDGNIVFGEGVGGAAQGVNLTDSQGLGGFGKSGNVFAGNITRHALSDSFSITLTNLPTHNRLDIGFLFAAIDSWDGTDVFPSGNLSSDFFNVTVDGVSLFQESFRNALRDDDPFCNTGEICQSYVPPPGAQIALGTASPFANIGFGGSSDGAYDMSQDSVFQNIVHDSSSVVIEFFGSGNGNQGFADESFGLDNISVSVSQVPVPPGFILLASALFGLRSLRRSTA